MSNLAKRILSASVLLPPVVALIIWGGPLLFSAFMVALAGIAGFEFGNITIGSSFRNRRLLVGLFASMIAASVSVYGHGPVFADAGHERIYFLLSHAPMAALILIVPAALLAFMFNTDDPVEAVPAALHSVAGAAYTGGLFGVMSLIFAFSDDGNWWVLLLAAGTFMGDTMAYTFGRLFGKRKMAPKLSPKKTWAGAFGGLFGTVLTVLVMKLTLLPSLEWYDLVALGVPLSVFCQVGDLAESFVKRGFDIKDSGNIIPGHGGILDRCDALMFGAPVVFVFSLLR